MIPAFKDLYRKVEQKNNMLGKIRHLLDKKSATLVYKQTVLLFLDYIGFIMLSCTVGMRRDLKKLQNDALRMCLRFRLADRITVQRLHNEARLQSVEQRGLFQLLKLIPMAIVEVQIILMFHKNLRERRLKLCLIYQQDVLISI